MVRPIDTRRFELGLVPGEESRFVEALTEDARAFAAARTWGPIVGEILHAFSVEQTIGLFLVRFTEPLDRGESKGDTERWLVVGDLPWMQFETEPTPKPSIALRLYCAIAQDWADCARKGKDLSQSYPIPVEPTKAYALMLLDRVKFIRKKIIPLCRRRVG